jgi:hypothetical protein
MKRKPEYSQNKVSDGHCHQQTHLKEWPRNTNEMMKEFWNINKGTKKMKE